MQSFNSNFRRRNDGEISSDDDISVDSSSYDSNCSSDDSSSSGSSSNDSSSSDDSSEIKSRRSTRMLFKWRKKATNTNPANEDNASSLSYHSVADSVREFIDNVENTFDTVLDSLYLSDEDDEDSTSTVSDNESNEQRNFFTKRARKPLSPSAIQKKMTQTHTPKHDHGKQNDPSDERKGSLFDLNQPSVGFYSSPTTQEIQTPEETDPLNQNKGMFFKKRNNAKNQTRESQSSKVATPVKNESIGSFFDLGQPSISFYNWPLSAKNETQEVHNPPSTKSLPSKTTPFKFNLRKKLPNSKNIKNSPHYAKPPFQRPSTPKSPNSVKRKYVKGLKPPKSASTKRSPSAESLTAFNFGRSPNSHVLKAIEYRNKEEEKSSMENRPSSTRSSARKSSFFDFGGSKKVETAIKSINTITNEEPEEQSNWWTMGLLSTKSAIQHSDEPKKGKESQPKRPSSTKSLKSRVCRSFNFGINEYFDKNLEVRTKFENPDISTPSNMHQDQKATPKSIKCKDRLIRSPFSSHRSILDESDTFDPSTVETDKNSTPKSIKCKDKLRSPFNSKLCILDGSDNKPKRSAIFTYDPNSKNPDPEATPYIQCKNRLRSPFSFKRCKLDDTEEDYLQDDADSLATPPQNKNAFWNELVSLVYEEKVPLEITIQDDIKTNRFPTFARSRKGRGVNAYASL